MLVWLGVQANPHSCLWYTRLCDFVARLNLFFAPFLTRIILSMVIAQVGIFSRSTHNASIGRMDMALSVCRIATCSHRPATSFESNEMTISKLAGLSFAFSKRGSREYLCLNHSTIQVTDLTTRVGLGVPEGMLGPPFPSRPDRLACMGLVSHMIVK